MVKAMDKWLPGYLRGEWKRHSEPRLTDDVHLIIAVCDHYEPFHHAEKAEAMERVSLWHQEFPRIVENFEDSGGVSPKHSFFYPIEQYDETIVEGIAAICEKTGSEVEVHLHHDNDTAENLADVLEKGKTDLRKHGLLGSDRNGEERFGFIHGNWCLDNSRPDGRWCGVENEIAVLARAGCYADLTLPAAPDPSQTRTINTIYYAEGRQTPKSHDSGARAVCGKMIDDCRRYGPDADTLLLIQGPLGFNWRWRKFGIVPRMENGDLTGANPPTRSRLLLWEELGISVKNRPEWVFVKLHTHGAIQPNSGMLLGEPTRQFHALLKSESERRRTFHYHYATAREMVNLVHAAEAGESGSPGDYRNYRYTQPPRIS